MAKGRKKDVNIKKGIVGAGEKDSNFRTGIRVVQYIQKPGYLLEIDIVRHDW